MMLHIFFKETVLKIKVFWNERISLRLHEFNLIFYLKKAHVKQAFRKFTYKKFKSTFKKYEKLFSYYFCISD